jgi:hypothetical protein
MNSNRDLLKEAIADAKAVKETAIANAKAALEESFGPFLREKLAMKLEEIDNLDETLFQETEMQKETYLDEDSEETEMQKETYLDEDSEDTKNLEELDLEELLKELDGIEEGEEGIKEAKEEEIGKEEEEINIEDMSADDLKDFIESVIADMVEAGELEGNIEGGEGKEEMEMGDEEKMMDEVDLEELMAEIRTERAYENYGLEEAKRKAAKAKMEKEEAEEKAKKAKKELEEAYNTIKTMQSTLNEVNLLNAKLLYTNKIFKSKSLTESQKVKVLTAFDKATSKKEAQLVYETLLEGLKEKKTQVNESMLGGASKVIGGPAPKQPIIEVNNQFARWQKLAGINK